MFWSKGPDKPPSKDPKDDASRTAPSQKPLGGQLPTSKNVVAKVDQGGNEEDSVFEEFVEGYAPDSTDTNIRYAAYTNRIRTILGSAHRYVAYTSDIGESFRPVAHLNLVRVAYGISWVYIFGDVSYEGYRAWLHNERARDPHRELSDREHKISGLEKKSPAAIAASSQNYTGKGGEATQGVTGAAVMVKPREITPLEDYRTVMVQRGIFQSLASMGLPALTIHSVVRYSGRAMKDMKNKTVRTWAPIGLGLAIVPFLPSIFDEPVENAVEWAFHKGFEVYGGKAYVGEMPSTGREKELSHKPST